MFHRFWQSFLKWRFNRPIKVEKDLKSKKRKANKQNKMIKFRYKRKEPANNSSSPSSNSVKSTNNKSVETKSTDIKDDNNKHNGSLKCETNESKTSPQIIKAKTSSEQEYMDGCIRAIVVSVFKLSECSVVVSISIFNRFFFLFWKLRLRDLFEIIRICLIVFFWIFSAIFFLHLPRTKSLYLIH